MSEIPKPAYRQRQERAAQREQQARRLEDNINTIGALNRLADEIHTANHIDTPKERGKRRREWLTIGGLFAAAGAAIIAILVSHTDSSEQIHALSDQLKVLQAQERAWIAPGVVTATQNFVDEKEEGAAIGFTFGNTGKEPATKVNQQLGVDVIEWTKFRDDDFIKGKVRELLGNRDCNDLEVVESGSTIFPGGRGELSSDLAADKVVLAAKKRSHYVLAAGCFVYRTIATTHRTQFCSILAPPNFSNDNKWQSVTCFVHNDAD